ncbi:MAG TPA: hypothetical protein VGK89_09665 [Candidatus Eisenbacteria bacterium]|jgi:hypothetical protein
MSRARASRPRGAIRLALAAAALLAAVVAAGCSCVGKPKYEPLHTDSTATVPVDSLATLVRGAQDAWEQDGEGENAALLSARLVLNDLVVQSRIEPTMSWEDRARALLDSLGIGGEVASDRCALVVNFFSRSNPDQGAWPWLFWCGENAILSEPLDARGLKLLALAGRGLWGDPPTPPGPPSVAVLFGRRASGGQQPLLTAWDLGGGHPSLSQTLGPDSLGGVGKGEFSAIEDSSIQLTVRAYLPTAGFSECGSCPHVWQVRRFLWEPYGFERISVETQSSPYAVFVQFVQAITSDDRDRAKELVVDREWVDTARRLGWHEPGATWRVAPGTEENADEMVFFRSPREAYRVTFEPRGGEWLISGFRSTTTSIE